MAAALTDEAWDEICKAGLRHKARLTPDADARAEMAAILFVEFPTQAYDRKTVAADLRRSKAKVGHYHALAALYGEPKPVGRYHALAKLPPGPDDVTLVRDLDFRIKSRPDDVHLRDLYFLEMLHRRALALMFARIAKQRANADRKRRKKDAPRKRLKKDAQREWLVSRLCGIWLNWFSTADGRHRSYEHLTITRPTLGGPPEGPLIEFLTAAMRLVMPDAVPDAEKLSYAIERERKERGRAAQLKLQLPPGGWRRN